ncbi:MAG: NnrU family protein [Cellvibrionaceae bacterium]|nr:NnrU family protein [Cellvibrionaceae bacterium]
MDMLILGLALFLATHLLPSVPSLRNAIFNKLGPLPYKGLYTIITLAGLVLMIKGLMIAPFQALYDPPSWGRHLAMLLMLPAVYLFLSNTAAPLPSSAKAITAFPTSWSVLFWATAHLLANGDVAHTLLFTGLGAFAVISIISGRARGAKPQAQRPPQLHEAITLGLTIVIYGALVWGHVHFTGMPLIPA